MTSYNVRVREALRIIYKAFPEVEFVKPDGSREKLSVILGLAVDVKSRPAIARQSKKSVNDQQLTFDLRLSSTKQQRGGT